MVDGNQFSFRCKSINNKEAEICTVLFPYKGEGRSKSKLLNAWDWNLGDNLKDSYYHALFPRSWSVYNCFQDIRLQCTQISPVIGHNYKESCYPCCVFSWEIENNSNEEKEISLMFTWENTIGLFLKHGHGSGHSNKKFSIEKNDKKISGIQMHHNQTVICEYKKKKLKHKATYHDPLQYAIAAIDDGSGKITFRTSTKVTNFSDSQLLWNQFKKDGKLSNEDNQYKTEKGERICGALCYTNKIPPNSKINFQFSVAWDMPIIRFGCSKAYYRRYTKFYGLGEDIVQNIATDALFHWSDWNEQIENWQLPILSRNDLPDYYKYGLFNELYYLVSGGSEWIQGEVEHNINLEKEELSKSTNEAIEINQNLLKNENELEEEEEEKKNVNDKNVTSCNIKKSEEFGQFLYLESLDYLMYNTYDVHWYASFALAKNWPEIELTIQNDFAIATLEDYNEDWKILSSGSRGFRKVGGAVPHDIGNPGGNPWNCVNSYNIQDVSRWKDLNCKFILQTYRDYLLTKNKEFLENIWPVVMEAIEYLLVFTNYEDQISTEDEKIEYEKKQIKSPYLHCIIENQGFPDQTYDAWSVTGVSAYCGGLWIASLAAIKQMAKILKKNEIYLQYRQKYKYAKIYYEKLLWNGKYLNYDSSTSSICNSIMADQLAGNWYAKSCFLHGIIDDDKAKLALETIYNFNFKQFKDGSLGVVNGMRPSGKVDKSCLQSIEVWTGTCYSLAAHMWQMGMKDEALEIIKSIIDSTYNLGYGFQTPEAWEKNGRYRALSYMRPLSIWAIQWAIDQEKGKKSLLQ